MASRRDFLKDSLALVSLGLTVPSVFGRGVLAAAAEAAGATSGKTLVVVQLQGGTDGLNLVVPYNEGAYRDNRPTIAIPEANLLPLNDRVAFPKQMSGLKQVFDAGQMAIVEGVGYPNPNYSHFRAMDIWQSADPGATAREGWLGRYFEGLTDLDGHPLAGLSVGRALPSAFESSEVSVPSVEDVQTFGLQTPTTTPWRQASLVNLYDSYKPKGSAFAALLDTTLNDALLSSTQLKSAALGYKPAVTYPNSPLASGLQMIAQLIDSGKGVSPLRVGHVMLTGFDTHTQQTQRLDTLMQQTSDGLSAFWADIVAHGHGNDVLIMTWSEFGRRVKENGQDGSDHGSAVPMFLIGQKVKGGMHGAPPSLRELDNGNLRFTTDFRSVYATILERWLQAPSDKVLGARFDPLDLLSA